MMMPGVQPKDEDTDKCGNAGYQPNQVRQLVILDEAQDRDQDARY